MRLILALLAMCVAAADLAAQATQQRQGPIVRGTVIDAVSSRPLPGVTVQTIDMSCSGMAGTWGLKAANYDTSLDAGRRMIEEVSRPRILFGSTECSACRLQMQEGSGKRTLHPVQYLAYAYGLLPEIGTRLQRPLGERVSD